MPVAFHPLVVRDVRRETDEVVSVAFEVPDALCDEYRYQPGQHLTLRACIDGDAGQDHGAGEVRRSYSICSGLDERELRVAVKRVPGGRFSEWLHARLRPGMPLDVMTPAGRFTTKVDPTRSTRRLALAVGKGITPIMAILKSTLACEPRSQFTLVYGNRGVASILFREQLADLKDRYPDRLQVIHVLSRQHQAVELFNGRLDADRLRELATTLIDLQTMDEVFVCVPQPTAVDVRDALRELGVPPERTHVELFGTPHTPRKATATSASAGSHHLSVVARGVRSELELDAETTLLEAGLRAGLDLPFSCRDGVCATCRAKVTAGEVTMAANYALEPWELQRGFVLTCQSRPTSEAVSVDYDQV